MSARRERQSAIRLMIVDDHEVVRAGLRALLNRSEGIQVVGEAGTVNAALVEAARLKPDVILMDLRLPDGNGVDACREIRSALPETRILFLTAYPDERALTATLLAQAAGYLLKDIAQEPLVRAIKAAAQGEPILDARVTGPMLGRIRTQIETENGDHRIALSPQERRVLALVVEGRTNREIAEALALSDKTVKNYLSNAFQKLNVRRRAQAAAIFSRQKAALGEIGQTAAPDPDQGGDADASVPPDR